MAFERVEIVLPIPKLSVKNYDEMLGKLTFFQFVWAYAALLTIRLQVPEVQAFAYAIEQDETLKLFQVTNVVPAAILAFVGHAFRLHDQVSKVFGLRKSFDMNHLVLPLAVVSGAQISLEKISSIRRNRHPLMRGIFYKFASSGSSTNRLVDEHDITKALTAWSWFWVCIEFVLYALLLSIVLAAVKAFAAAFVVLAAALAMLLFSNTFWVQLEKNALIQLRQIVAVPAAVAEIKSQFDAL